MTKNIVALDQSNNNPRDRAEQLQRTTRGTELHFTRKIQIRGFLGPPTISLGCRTNLCSLTPDCQNLESHFCLIKASKQEEKIVQKCFGFQICWRLESPACERYCVLLMPRTLIHLHSGRWSNVISSARNLKAVVLQNDIHEKQWKTELRLIRVMMTLQAEQSN